jgi:hypothetical protein
MHLGDKVILNTPDNPRLHSTVATITELTEWGAHVETPAAATGQFRAALSEMVLPHANGRTKSTLTGDVCPTCGGINMARSGACLTCQDCGSTSGCG